MAYEVGKQASVAGVEGEVVAVSPDTTRVSIRIPGGKVLDCPTGDPPINPLAEARKAREASKPAEEAPPVQPKPASKPPAAPPPPARKPSTDD